MPPNIKKTLLLLTAWLALELLICSLVTVTSWRQLREWERDPSSTNHPAMLWDARRGLAGIVAVQIVQPLLSVALLTLLRPARTRGSHAAKALLVGVVAGFAASLIGWFVYSSFPRPGYWSLGNLFAEIFITVPVFQGASALIGGMVCGIMDFRLRRRPAIA